MRFRGIALGLTVLLCGVMRASSPTMMTVEDLSNNLRAFQPEIPVLMDSRDGVPNKAQYIVTLEAVCIVPMQVSNYNCQGGGVMLRPSDARDRVPGPGPGADFACIVDCSTPDSLPALVLR